MSGGNNLNLEILITFHLHQVNMYLHHLVKSLFLICSLIFQVASQCRQCDQQISGRNLEYDRALEIIQNEEYLDASDFDEIRIKRKYRRKIRW